MLGLCGRELTENFCLLTLSQTTNFRLFQTERVCRQQIKFHENGRKSFIWVKKHCGQRRNCSFRAISPFRTVFSKDLYCRHTCKNQGLFGKRLRSHHTMTFWSTFSECLKLNVEERWCR